jgi:RNA polymerase sigma-70 factor (ECF subfamily)
METDILKPLRESDEKAWNEVYETYSEKLYEFIYYRVGMQESDAKDIFQETMLTAVSRIGSCRGPIYPWLCGIARNKILHLYRARKRQNAKELKILEMDKKLMDWYSYLETEPISEDLLAREDTKRMVSAILSMLPDNYKQSLILKYIEGYSLEEISQELNISVHAVGQLIYRARKYFKSAFAKYMQEEVAF